MLDEVRSAARRVAEAARLVRIRHDALAPYAASLPLERALGPGLDPATHYVGEPDATLAYVLMLDAINFGSGYFPRVRKRAGMSGYFSMTSGLKERFETLGPYSPGELERLTARDCAEVFGQELDNPDAMELMGLFAQALRDLGELVTRRYGGSYRALVETADGSAERLLGLLAEMPFYRDVSLYEGTEVPFYKRAQLTSADLSIAGVAQFHDLDRLTIFADNLVPHVMRVDGVLQYDSDLAARIDREELIKAGSAEEVEIRACALHAVELIAAGLEGQVTAMGLDYVLWNRGQEPKYKAIPRHRARSVFY
jgi:hypothetical protein